MRRARPGAPRRPLHLPLLALLLLTPLARAPQCDSGPALNQILDDDGDGLPDRVRVSDFDGDGVLEMDDVQDAVESLTDPGPKRVDVWPGSYQPPASPASRPGRTHALVELPSRTTLACPAGPAFTQLRGPSGTTVAHDFAVIANDDHVLGNEDVVVSGCDIHGGAPDSYDRRSVQSANRRAGVFFRKTLRGIVKGSWVHHTYHTGLYTSNSRGDRFLDNLVSDAGGWGDRAPGHLRLNLPCIYLFAFGGGAAVEDFVARGNHLLRCASAGLNTRAEHTDAPGDVVRNMLWEDNTVEDTGYAVGDGPNPSPGSSACASVRGVDGAVVRGLRCRSTGPVFLTNYTSAFRSDGDDNAVSNVLLEDIVVEGADTIAGVYVGAYAENLTLRNVRVLGTHSNEGKPIWASCLVFETPLRGARFEDLELRDCGRAGVEERTQLGSGGRPEERLSFLRVLVEGVDAFDPTDSVAVAAFEFQGPHEGLVLEDLEVRRATGPEIWFPKTVTNARLSRVTIESSDPGWLGAFHEAQVPACDASREKRWITTRDGLSASDCSFAPGTQDSTPARCACRSGAWAYFSPVNVRSGIEFGLSGAASRDVLLEDVAVANARGLPGVRVDGAVQRFDVLGIEGRDDSEATDVPQTSAIRFTGAVTGVVVEDAVCIGTDPAYACVELPGGMSPPAP